jgi:hypothetical protein
MREEMRTKTNLSWQRIIGNLIDGFGTKLIVAGIALILAHEVYGFITKSLAPVATAMGAN